MMSENCFIHNKQCLWPAYTCMRISLVINTTLAYTAKLGQSGELVWISGELCVRIAVKNPIVCIFKKSQNGTLEYFCCNARRGRVLQRCWSKYRRSARMHTQHKLQTLQVRSKTNTCSQNRQNSLGSDSRCVVHFAFA